MEEYEDDQRHSWNKAFCGKGIREWAFWFIVTFLACLTVKDVINLIREYSENPKKSDMNVRFNDTMRVPNMTFCMSRAQAWSHFRVNESDTGEGWAKRVKEQLKNMTEREQFLTRPWELEMTMETQQRLGEIRKLAKFWMAEIEQRNVTFDNFLQKVGKETLRSSMQRFQRTTYEEEEVIRTQTMITWLSQMQLCFQPAFDLNNSKPINDQGQFFVMILSHNAEKLSGQQIDCMSVDFHGRPSSSTRFMGSKGVTKDGFTDELCMGMMHEITVEVKARYKMLPNDEEGTACRERAEDVDNEYDCHLRCRMEFIRNVCHCTGPTLSYLVKDENELNKWPLCDYSKCATEASQGQNYSDADCTKKCFRDCEQIRFNVIHEKKGKSLHSDLTTVLLNWGSFEYLTLEQDWVWQFCAFANTKRTEAVQGSTYMYGYVTDNVIKKKRRFSIQETHKESLSEERENKLSVNPLASPFKKPSQTQPTAE
uniref:Amiloride-sensitive sodium channel n=1 Tax=Globodera pallida TaxID=36090 RepID=A0A183BJU4_GLOPA